MEIKTLLKANLKSHRGTVLGVFVLILLVSLCLFRIVWIQWILPFFPAIDGVFVLYPVSWLLGVILMVLYAWKGRWLPQNK